MCGGAPSAPPPKPLPKPTRLAELPGGQKAPRFKKRARRSLRTVRRSETPQGSVTTPGPVSL